MRDAEIVQTYNERSANRYKMKIQTSGEDNMAAKTEANESTLATHEKRKRCKVKQHASRDEGTLPKGCTGIALSRTPTLAVKKCPKCGNAVEIFSSDVEVQCDGCRLTIINDLNSCTRWCVHSKECGDYDFTEETEKEDGDDFFVAINNYVQQFMKE